MHIRPATPADCDALLALRVAMFEEAGFALSADEWQRVVEANRPFFAGPRDDCHSWVAEDGGLLVGMGTLAVFTRPPYPGNLAGRESYLLNMYTAPSHRRRGVARAIVAAALGFAEAAGHGKVWLHASEAGRPVYEQAGFMPASSYLERPLPSSLNPAGGGLGDSPALGVPSTG